MMGKDEYQFLIGQTLVFIHLVLPADPHAVHKKTSSQEVRYQLSLIALYHVLTLFLSLPNVQIFRCYTFEEGDCFRFDRSRIDCCHLILSFEPEGPGLKLNSPASRPRCCN